MWKIRFKQFIMLNFKFIFYFSFSVKDESQLIEPSCCLG